MTPEEKKEALEFIDAAIQEARAKGEDPSVPYVQAGTRPISLLDTRRDIEEETEFGIKFVRNWLGLKRRSSTGSDPR